MTFSLAPQSGSTTSSSGTQSVLDGLTDMTQPIIKEGSTTPNTSRQMAPFSAARPKPSFVPNSSLPVDDLDQDQQQQKPVAGGPSIRTASGIYLDEIPRSDDEEAILDEDEPGLPEIPDLPYDFDDIDFQDDLDLSDPPRAPRPQSNPTKSKEESLCDYLIEHRGILTNEMDAFEAHLSALDHEHKQALKECNFAHRGLVRAKMAPLMIRHKKLQDADSLLDDYIAAGLELEKLQNFIVSEMHSGGDRSDEFRSHRSEVRYILYSIIGPGGSAELELGRDI